MRILAKSFGITVVVAIERQSALFASTSLPSNLSVYAPGLYAQTKAQRQFYLLSCISPCLSRPAWPNSGPTMSTKCYRSRIVISTARALKTLGLKACGDNNDSNALTHGSIISRHFRLKLSTGKTSDSAGLDQGMGRHGAWKFGM
jgi:hypothetical protein